MQLRSLAARAVDALYPRLCRSCGAKLGAEAGFFCASCISGAERLEGAFCTVCAEPLPDASGEGHVCRHCMRKPPQFTRARAPYLYRGVIKDAVQFYKYGGLRALEGFLAGGFEGRLTGWFGRVGLVAAVPLHKSRLRERGFNQALLLARHAAMELSAGLPVDCLVRTRNTRPQVSLTPQEREQNVRGAFSVPRPELINGRVVLLVDDVYTTGATVRECAMVMKKAGAADVCVLTVARA